MSSAQKKIKVLIRLRSLEMGGVQKVILDLLQNLPLEKFDFTLLVNLKQGILQHSIPDHVKFLYLEKGREDFSKNPLIYKIQLITRNLRLKFYKKYPKFIYDKFNLWDYDVEVASSYSEMEDVLNSPNKKSKKIAWFHTDIRYVERNLALKFIEWMKKFDLLIFGSKQTRDVIFETYQERFPNSQVVYNVIDSELIKTKSKEFKIERNSTVPQLISVARLQKRKGYDMLAKVHKKLLDEGILHEIHIIGDGNYRPEIEKLIDELDIAKSFVLLGTQKNPYPYIQAADFFVFPSTTESYPLIIGETLCLGKLIISTDVGGINEMIDNGKNGILVQPNEESIYVALKNVLTNPDFSLAFDEELKNAFKSFDKEKIYTQITELFSNNV